MLVNLFSKPKPIIGVIHVGALPGTPNNSESVSAITEKALQETRVYLESGVDGIIIENMHDVPYLKGEVGAEITASMAVIAKCIKEESGLPAGVQVLAGANIEAMAVAHAADLDFIRAEGFAFAHVADEGFIESSAAKLLRYRKMIGAEKIQVWADIKKKHSSHAITSDISIGEMAETVEFMRGSAVIVTGSATGNAPKIEDIQEAKAHCRLPVVLGSGVDADNIREFFDIADAFIIGSYFKFEGHWANEIAPKRVGRLMDVMKELRNS